MTRKHRALAFALIALGVTVFVRIVEPMERYTFGHPDWVDRAVWSQLWLLCMTHVALAAIMWLQRRRWLPSEEAMFVFIAVKAVFWGNLATSYVFRGVGIRLDIAALYVFMLTATVWLDVTMVRRYVFGAEDSDADL
jgi:hypothetical protein